MTAPITTADMRALLREKIEASHRSRRIYWGLDDMTIVGEYDKQIATYEAILARLEQQEPPSAVVSVEALRALPRYELQRVDTYFGDDTDLFADLKGDLVKWSDLAALWPPQTGDRK